MNPMEGIRTARQKIDLIDEEIIQKLTERMGYAGAIVNIKRDAGINIKDSERESYIIASIESKVPNPNMVIPIQKIFLAIMEETSNFERIT
jgi:chorismate mutase